MSFRKDDQKLLEKYETIWTKNEDLKSVGLNDLPVYDDRYIKIKIRTYHDKVYTNFRASSVPDDIECKSFTVLSSDSLLIHQNSITCIYIQTIGFIKLQASEWQITLMTIILKMIKIRCYYNKCYYNRTDISQGIDPTTFSVLKMLYLKS